MDQLTLTQFITNQFEPHRSGTILLSNTSAASYPLIHKLLIDILRLAVVSNCLTCWDFVGFIAEIFVYDCIGHFDNIMIRMLLHLVQNIKPIKLFKEVNESVLHRNVENSIDQKYFVKCV